MFVGVGVGAYAAGIFHLVTHAFFKALLFLGAGSVIHGLSGEQDLRKMGGLAPRMMTTTVTFLVGAFGLAGVPPLAGFFSKDETPRGVPRSPLPPVGAPAGRRVHDRLLHLPARVPRVLRGPRMPKEVAHHIHESPAVMTLPLVVLAPDAVAGLAVGIPSSQGTAFAHFLAPEPSPLQEAEHIRGSRSACWCSRPSWRSPAGVALAWMVYGRTRVRAALGVARNPVHKLLIEEVLRGRGDPTTDALRGGPILPPRSGWPGAAPGLIDGIVNGVGRLGGWQAPRPPPGGRLVR